MVLLVIYVVVLNGIPKVYADAVYRPKDLGPMYVESSELQEICSLFCPQQECETIGIYSCIRFSEAQKDNSFILIMCCHKLYLLQILCCISKATMNKEAIIILTLLLCAAATCTLLVVFEKNKKINLQNNEEQ